ncbi:hypothetical protein RHDE110596_10935 [Prescottella defluvii]
MDTREPARALPTTWGMPTSVVDVGMPVLQLFCATADYGRKRSWKLLAKTRCGSCALRDAFAAAKLPDAGIPVV